jgi:hypothetical protein
VPSAAARRGETDVTPAPKTALTSTARADDTEPIVAQPIVQPLSPSTGSAKPRATHAKAKRAAPKKRRKARAHRARRRRAHSTAH